MGWYEATNAHFHRDYLKRRSWAFSWERRQSQYVQSYCFPNILLDSWEGLKAYTFEKRRSKSAQLKKNLPPRVARRNYFPFFPAALRAVQHDRYTTKLPPTPMCFTENPKQHLNLLNFESLHCYLGGQ